MRAWIKRRQIVLACGIAAVLMAVSVFSVGYAINTTTGSVCSAISGVNTELVTFLQTQSARIGAKGTATYGYYHNHPQRQAQAKQGYQQFVDGLRASRPAGC